MPLVKNPTVVARRQGRAEILEQIAPEPEFVRKALDREEARKVVDEAMQKWPNALIAANEALHATIEAMDPALRHYVSEDHYDERLFTTYWVYQEWRPGPMVPGRCW